MRNTPSLATCSDLGGEADRDERRRTLRGSTQGHDRERLRRGSRDHRSQCAIHPHSRPAPTWAAKLTATNVAERFAVPHKGTIAKGFDADLAIIDLNAQYTLTRDMLRPGRRS